MATLFNHTDADLFCAALHVTVPANGSVEIDDADVERVNTVSGVWKVERAERAEPKQPATRAAAKRGGKSAEVSAAPAMETR